MKTLLFLAPLTFAVAGYSAPGPRTMIQIVGGQSTPSKLSESVVLIIDAQREYTDGRLPLHNIGAALAQTQRLLQRARSAGVPVIHIQQLSPPGRGLFDSDGPDVAFVPEATPLPGETIVTKVRPNAFSGTSLDETLKESGRTKIIISGYMTHMCVSATARAALDFGYKTTIIADACATRDLPDRMGGTLSAAEVHRTALAELADRFSTVVATVDDIPN